jgi:L-fuconolactonase
MRIIDAHQHFWIYNSEKHNWISEEMSIIKRDFLPSDLQKIMIANNVEACISVQVDQNNEETISQIEFAKSNEFIKGVVGWIDLLDSKLEDKLNYYKQYSIVKGFRHILQGTQEGFMLQPKFTEGLKKISKYGYSYDLLIYNNQLEEAIKLVKELDDLPIVLNHIAKPNIKEKDISDWSKKIKILAKNKNLSCKLSGLVTEANWQNWTAKDLLPYVEIIVESFGIDRIMFGSDWPVCLVATSYDTWLNFLIEYFNDFSQNEKEKFFALNCEKFYKLKIS